jgi:CheY-like chemotaxis protein
VGRRIHARNEVDTDAHGRPSEGGAPDTPRDPHRDLSGALHDVSNALTVLLGWIAEARAPDASRETTAYALSVIERRARMARDLARRAIGAPTEDLTEEQPLEDVLSEVVETLGVEAARSGVRIVRTGPVSLVRLPFASDATQVLTNLLLNAIAFSPSGGEVRIDVSVQSPSILIAVEDDGPGIPDAQRAVLFEGVSTRPGGAGVGLRHARALARASGGELSLLPAHQRSRGARFQLAWPQSSSTIPPPPPSVSRVPVLAGKRVLVVEDDADVVSLLETALGARGADVTVARNAQELARVVAESPHDAALVDLSPIERDVSGALRLLRGRSPHAPVVLITGSVAGLPEALAHERWVRKPFEVGEVVSALIEAGAGASRPARGG